MKQMSLGSVLSYESILTSWRSSHHSSVFIGNFLLNFVTNTNQLEGINIDYHTTRELFESEQLTSYTGDLRSVFSVLNNRNVANYLNGCLSTKERLTPDLIRETHRLLMFASMDRHRYEDNGERAGNYKVNDYCVGRYSVGSLPDDVAEDIESLCNIIEGTEQADALKIATVFQCFFAHIHPFADGNGRVGRWLTNYLLVLNNHPPVLFTRESRKEYFDALERFDTAEDYQPMVDYLRTQTLVSWHAVRELI